MGQRKQIIVLISVVILVVTYASPAGRQGWCIEEVLDQNRSNDIDNKLERLQIYFETEMYPEASAILEELILEFPDEPKFEYLRAIVDYEMGNYDRTERVLMEFIEKYPDVPEPYYLLGEINLNTDNKDMAKQYLRKYCELVPEDYEAQDRLSSIFAENSSRALIMEYGRENSQLVKKVGFYGACVHSYEKQSVKLINGSHRSWSSMGIDFVYPIDLRGKQVALELKGKQGGERLELTFRDKFAKSYNPQLVLVPEKSATRRWKKIKVAFSNHQPGIDLSQIVHLGLEFGFSTVRNPANSTLYVKDIIVEDARN